MKTKRRRLLVDQAVQGGIALRLTVYWLCSIIMAFVMMVVVQCVMDPLTPFFTQLSRAQAAVFPVVASFLLLLPMVLRDLTRLTNRFAGPVVHLKRALRDLRDETFRGELKFREGDYWHDLADEFNLLASQVETWKRSVERTKEESALVANGVDE